MIASGGSAGGHLAAATALVEKFEADDPKFSEVGKSDLTEWDGDCVIHHRVTDGMLTTMTNLVKLPLA